MVIKFNRDINLQDDIQDRVIIKVILMQSNVAKLNSNKTTIFNIQTYLVH